MGNLAYVACANFVNANDAGPSSKKAAGKATKTTGQASASASGNGSGSGGNGGGSSTSSPGSAPRTAAPLIGAGVLGLAALVF